MSGALLLFALAIGLMAVGQFGLARAAWPQRSPRLGIAQWRALTTGVVACLVLGSLALALPGLSAASTVGELLRACLVELRRQFSHPQGAVVSSIGIGLVLLLVTRITVSLTRARRSTNLTRRNHRSSLSIVAEEPQPGLYTLDTRAVAVYCVPGDRAANVRDAVVVTRGAIETLTAEQLRLVLGHERAHLRSRHDRLVARANALAVALPWLPFFWVAHEQIACLAEMHADDAAPEGDRPTLADALYRLSAASSNAPPALGGLAAAGSSTALRISRLLAHPGPLRMPGVALVRAGIVALALAPAALALVPTGLELTHDCCVVTLDAKPQATDG